MPELSLLSPECPASSAKVRLAEVAARQWGVVSVGQLADLGLGSSVVSDWVREHRLHRIHPGVYAVGHSALGVEGRLAAALFYAGPGAVLFGVTAAYWWGMLRGEPQRMHVAVPGRRRSLPSVRVREQRQFERVWHKRLPLTPPAQTLLEIAAQVRMMELRRALAEAEYQRLVTLDEVGGVLGRGKPGSAALRVAMECHNPRLARTKSKLEDLLIAVCERYAVTLPDGVNVVVVGWLVDAVWYGRRVVVELDGYAAHSTPARLERDHRRDLDLRAAGFVVLRYTWHQLMHEPERVVADLRRALENRGDQLRHLARHPRAGHDEVEARLLGPEASLDVDVGVEPDAGKAGRAGDLGSGGIQVDDHDVRCDVARGRRRDNLHLVPGGAQRGVDLRGEEQIRRDRQDPCH